MIVTCCCYLKKDNKTLFLKRTKKEKDISKYKYLGIGGKCEKNEFVDDALIREVKEETNLNLNSFKLKGTVFYPNFGGEIDELVYFYTSDDFCGEIMDCNEGELVWVDDENINSLNLWEGDKLIFEWFKNNKIFNAIMEYNTDGKLEKCKVNFY